MPLHLAQHQPQAWLFSTPSDFIAVPGQLTHLSLGGALLLPQVICVAAQVESPLSLWIGEVHQLRYQGLFFHSGPSIPGRTGLTVEGKKQELPNSSREDALSPDGI